MKTKHTVSQAIEHLQSKLSFQTMNQIQTIFGFHFKDINEDYTLDAQNENGRGWLKGSPAMNQLNATIQVTLTSEDFAKLVFGELNPMAGMATGRMWLKGDFKQALKLDRLLKG
ncbi:SCP2 sterol-binding domain-containing protein [Spirosoma spitsbergense]|uniref:SCP2 sterol-binding domain-containing protein n=1 Tax=Spirosoma spitsbergense TaxID=431554 RepID=UPI0003648610|nr:SCP2 sterol-binding domain-containing protein [Spirosoma spitsbergense]